VGARRPVYCDTEARIKAALRGSVPPFPVVEGHPLRGTEARVNGIWLERFAAQPPRIPLGFLADRRIESWRRGRRKLRAEEWAAIYDYVMEQKRLAQSRGAVSLRLGGIGVGGLTLGR